MVELTSFSWLDEHLKDPNVRVVDPRPIVKYLSGHVPGAVNLPLTRILDTKTLGLKPQNELEQVFGEVGLSEDATVVLYDSYDGQNAAMVSWVLEYLGDQNVRILSKYFEDWASGGQREVLYKPVKPQPRHFAAKQNRAVRISLEELWMKKNAKIVDFRSSEEFLGKVAKEARSGHIPGAINLPWTGFLGHGNEYLRPKQELEEIALGMGLLKNDHVVAYCSFGPRAAMGYVALQQLGYRDVAVYDGSFHQWAQHAQLPVEGEELGARAQKLEPTPHVGC
jgi:thiosulfate/3-mercaptopyruvate sulfurtransferase